MSLSIKLNDKLINSFLTTENYKKLSFISEYFHKVLIEKTGSGNDFLGWLTLPSKMLNDEKFFDEIEQLKNKWIEKEIDTAVVIGIGGSYLGTKAIIEALNLPFTKNSNIDIIFAGHHLSGIYLKNLVEYLKNKNYGLIVISKSGTTLEPALAFRVLLNELKKQYKDYNQRIIVITDEKKGVLRKLANQNNWTSFSIADDIGGRYSVLSPVGIVPLYFADVNINELLKGARLCEEELINNPSCEKNIALQYATLRHSMLSIGKPVEILASFYPQLQYFSEWWKQLFGESEGKQNRGILPTSNIFTTDLHSLGQYIQDGLRIIFETFITIKNEKETIFIEPTPNDDDGLNYLANKSFEYIQKQAERATMIAHYQGGVPVIDIQIAELNEYNLGQLIYFFEFSCAISGYLLEVNPFDQPGVEQYKNNMFALLGKPGMQNETTKLNQLLNNFFK